MRTSLIVFALALVLLFSTSTTAFRIRFRSAEKVDQKAIDFTDATLHKRIGLEDELDGDLILVKDTDNVDLEYGGVIATSAKKVIDIPLLALTIDGVMEGNKNGLIEIVTGPVKNSDMWMVMKALKVLAASMTTVNACGMSVETQTFASKKYVAIQKVVEHFNEQIKDDDDIKDFKLNDAVTPDDAVYYGNCGGKWAVDTAHSLQVNFGVPLEKFGVKDFTDAMSDDHSRAILVACHKTAKAFLADTSDIKAIKMKDNAEVVAIVTLAIEVAYFFAYRILWEEASKKQTDEEPREMDASDTKTTYDFLPKSNAASLVRKLNDAQVKKDIWAWFKNANAQTLSTWVSAKMKLELTDPLLKTYPRKSAKYWADARTNNGDDGFDTTAFWAEFDGQLEMSLKSTFGCGVCGKRFPGEKKNNAACYGSTVVDYKMANGEPVYTKDGCFSAGLAKVVHPKVEGGKVYMVVEARYTKSKINRSFVPFSGINFASDTYKTPSNYPTHWKTLYALQE